MTKDQEKQRRREFIRWVLGTALIAAITVAVVLGTAFWLASHADSWGQF